MLFGMGRTVIKFGTTNLVGFAQNPVHFLDNLVEFVRLNTKSKTAGKLLELMGPLVSAVRLPGHEEADSGELSLALKELRRKRFLKVLTLPYESFLRSKLFQLRPINTTGTIVERKNGSNQPKVLFLLTNALPYTQSGYTLRSKALLKSLQSRGIEVFAATRYGYPECIGRFHHGPSFSNEGIEYVVLGSVFPPFSLERQEELAVRQLVKLAKQKKINILHTTTPYTNARVVARAAARLKVPWIYEVRGEPESTWASQTSVPEVRRESEFFKLARNAETSAMMAADLVIALSDVSKEDLVCRGVPENKIQVVPNALEPDQLEGHPDKFSARKLLSLSDNEFLIGAITSVVDYEGIDVAITAMQEIPNATLMIVGDGAARPRLEALVDKCSLRDRVIFVGKQPASDIHYWYSALDVFVVPRKEAEVCKKVTPLKPLQAMANGVPVVGSDLPALEEITGGLMVTVEAENPAALAQAINAVRQGKIALNSEQLKEWAQKCSWDENARRLKKLYLGLLGGK